MQSAPSGRGQHASRGRAMRRTIGLSALLILLTGHPVWASDPQATELVGLMTMAVRGTTEQLQLVQHIESARLSAEPLGQFDKYFGYFLAQGKRVKIANADRGALQVYERAVSALEPEWNRVAADNDLKFVQERMPAFRRFMAERSGKRPELAAQGAQTLAAAALKYEIHYGQIPERLEQLIIPPGGAPLVDR